MAGPGDETAAGAGGHGRLRASHADREQVIGTLKAAFVQGMLARTNSASGWAGVRGADPADLAAVTADLPAGLAAAEPPEPARRRAGGVLRPGRMIAAATALYAGVWPFTFLLPWPTNSEGDTPGRPFAVLLDHPHLPVRFVFACGVCDRRVAGEAFRRAATAAASAWRGGPHPGACHRQARAGSFLRPVPVTGTSPKQPEAVVVPVGGGAHVGEDAEHRANLR